MIEFREKTYSKEKVVSSVLKKLDQAMVESSKSARKQGAKTIAKSLEKSRIKEIKEKYAGNPKIAERKLAQFKANRKTRLPHVTEQARRKLEVISPSRTAKTEEQIAAQTKKMLTPESPKEVAGKIKRGAVDTGKSVAKGLKSIYTDTGKVITDAREIVTKHPLTTAAFWSGDVVNAVGPFVGHPEVLAIPVSGITTPIAAAAEATLLPRGVKRKLRQSSIRIKKKAKESGFYDSSIKQMLTGRKKK